MSSIIKIALGIILAIFLLMAGCTLMIGGCGYVVSESTKVQESQKDYDLLAENCAKINYEHDRNFCYKNLAEESNEEKFCEMMIFSETKDYGNNQDYCFQNVAIAKLDENICIKIKTDPDSHFPNMRRDNCYKEIAEKKNDANICLNISIITRDWDRNYCIYEIATKNLDLQACELSLDKEGSYGENKCKDKIYSELAKG